MKLANVYWMNTELSDSIRAVNFGDILQLEIIDRMYNKFFKNREITRLTMKEVSSYTGEKLVLPLNWSLFDANYMDGDQIDISEDIVPVFLAMTVESGGFKESYINKYNINYLKKYEPIGCRDEKTKRILENNGVKAYLNGCLTIAMEKRNIVGNKILLIDVPVGVKEHLPDWKEKIEIFTQQKYFTKDCSIEDIRKDVNSRYEYYFNEAKLVVTSRLHVASPCRAAGIPVILVKNDIDARFPWMKVFLPLYDKANYNRIDWNPSQSDYEEKKQLIIQNAINRIKQALGEKTEEDYTKQVDELFVGTDTECCSFQSTVYRNFDKIKQFLENKYQEDDYFEYAIWGVGQAAENVYKYIQENYRRAELTVVIDTYKKVDFHGIESIAPSEYKRHNREIVLVVPVQASNMASMVLEECGLKKTEYVCAGELFIKPSDILHV